MVGPLHGDSSTPSATLNRRNLSSSIPTTTARTPSARHNENATTFLRPPSNDVTTQRLTSDIMKRFLVISVISSAVFMTLNITMLWHQHIRKKGHHRGGGASSLTHAEEFFSLIGHEFTRQDKYHHSSGRLGVGNNEQGSQSQLDQEDELLMGDSGEGRLGTAPYIRAERYKVMMGQQEEKTNTYGASTESSMSSEQKSGIGGGATTSSNIIDLSDHNKPWIIQPKGPKPPLRRAKVLMGIISADVPNDKSYRKRHRELFELWNDKRVCSLHEFEDAYDVKGKDSALYETCELIWTFIIGGNRDPKAPTELVQHNETNPILIPKPIVAKAQDINDPDTSLLNIRENMNEGKSQTFLYFASLLMEKYGIDYAMKCDADAILHLHDYFLFAHRNLPPPPYNTNIFVGALRDKAFWPKHPDEEIDRYESFFGTEFEGVHLYLAGQNYIVSQDLAAFISKEAQYSKGYVEGHEDHDISSMAFHSPEPVHMVTIAKSQRFWEHPVKGEPRWKRIWQRENCRMQQVPFEGKMLRLYLG